ncbi:MAG: hypothetical protein KAT74_10530, partial [Candidatus Cloacimonetes bacterium]|nr:hypothetical protein [Candidatus Cloacimonadota bacterium]
AYEFIIKDKKYFLPAEDFIKLELTTRDTLSLKFHALELLQDLVKFHINDEKKDALIDADLKRLQFIYQNTVNPDKINLYENALIVLKEKYKVLSASAEVSYTLANLYFQLGSKYNPLVSDEYKWYKKKAYDICVDIIELFPDTFGAENSRSLLQRIKEKILSLNVEKVNIPHKPILALFKYKNINQVYFRIIKLSFEEKSNYLLNNYYDEILNKFLEKEPIKEWPTTLPDDDFNQHSVEIKLPELGLGYYIVLISHKKDFDLEDNGIAYSPFTVSNISYIQRRTKDDIIEFHVFNRETGESIKDVKANIWFKVYNYTKRKTEIKKAKEEFLSDYYGYFHIRLPIKFDEKARNFYVSFTKDNDKLISSE